MSLNKMNPKSSKELSLKNLSDLRKQRAYSILEKGKPTLINESTYLVPSSDGVHKYQVTHIDSWTCECKDFQERCKQNGLYCKHIQSILLLNKLKNKVELDETNFENELNKESCPYCNSEDIFKRGQRKNKNGIKQVFCCKSCSKRFTLEPIKYIKGNAKLVCLAMDCYYKGLSFRDISDQFFQFYKLKISHVAVRTWV